MEMIRLGCLFCDRADCDGVNDIPASWFSVDRVQDFADSIRAAGVDGDVTFWQTHLGVCPECQEAELWPTETSLVIE
jgi:hypothetical protein